MSEPSLPLDLVNTWDPYFADPEGLPTPQALESFLAEHGIAPGRLDAAALREAKRVRDRLREAVEATDESRVAAILGELLAGALVTPRLTAAWEVELTPADGGAVEQLRVRAALDLAAALHDHGLDRLRTCASSPCREAFVDTSRNASRRFCSRRCASRFNVAAYRSRQAARTS